MITLVKFLASKFKYFLHLLFIYLKYFKLTNYLISSFFNLIFILLY